MKLKYACALEEKYDKPRQHIKRQRHHFAKKGPCSQTYSFSSSHVQMWESDYKESWAQTNWCFWTVVLEKTLESPLDCKEIQPVHSKRDQSWIFIERTDAESWNSNTLATWYEESTHWKRPWCREKIEDRRRRGRQRMKWFGWYHWLNGHEFEQTPGDRGQGSLVCYNPWVYKESDKT